MPFHSHNAHAHSHAQYDRLSSQPSVRWAARLKTSSVSSARAMPCATARSLHLTCVASEVRMSHTGCIKHTTARPHSPAWRQSLVATAALSSAISTLSHLYATPPAAAAPLDARQSVGTSATTASSSATSCGCCISTATPGGNCSADLRRRKVGIRPSEPSLRVP